LLLAVVAFVVLWLALAVRAITAPPTSAPVALVGLLALTGGIVELLLFPGVSDISVLLVILSTVALGE